MTKVISIRSGLPYDVYIGRAGHGQDGTLGNPIIIGRKCGKCSEWHRDGGSTIPCYEKYLAQRIGRDPEFKEHVKNLYGKTLACFCIKGIWEYIFGAQEKYICHGQVLARVAYALNNPEWDTKIEAEE